MVHTHTHTQCAHVYTYTCTCTHTAKRKAEFPEFLYYPETILESLILRPRLGNAMRGDSSLFIEWGFFALRRPRDSERWGPEGLERTGLFGNPHIEQMGALWYREKELSQGEMTISLESHSIPCLLPLFLLSHPPSHLPSLHLSGIVPSAFLHSLH